MAALPYMQLYVADYLADTAYLTTREHGAYLLLIFNYWQRGGPFHAKDRATLNARLARIAKLTAEEWEDVSPALEEFFEVTDTEWRHDRIERDLAAVKNRTEKASVAGKASAVVRLNPRSTPVERPLNDRSTPVERPLNHTDTDTEKDTTPVPIGTGRGRRYSPDDMAMAKQFWAELKAQQPGHKPPNLETWAGDIRLMREVDHRIPEQIRVLWTWARNDQLWRTQVFCPAKLRQKFDALLTKAGGAQDGPTFGPMTPGWLPSGDSVDLLVERGVNLQFIEDAVPEFELYWRERGIHTDNWDKKFRDHITRQWKRYREGLEHDTTPRRIPADWTPPPQVYEVLAMANIDRAFTDDLVGEFVLYWHETNLAHPSWGTKFLQQVKRRWAQRLAGPHQRSTRDMTIEEQLYDHSWALPPPGEQPPSP